MKDIIKVGIWIRVSTDMQVKDESPEHHELRAKHYIKAKDWNLVKIYRLDGISGKTVMNHPETQRMLKDVRSGEINGLVFSKLSRVHTFAEIPNSTSLSRKIKELEAKHPQGFALHKLEKGCYTLKNPIEAYAAIIRRI